MKEYLIFIAFSLSLAWVMERTYVGSPNSIATRGKDRLCIICITAVLALFVGLRTYYNDTFVYITLYEKLAKFPAFWKSFQPELGANPGFMITQAWLKSMNISSQGFLLFFAIISIGASVYFLKTYSNSFVLSLFLFFATNAYTLSAAALKQSVAIAISLIAVKFALEKKWLIFAAFMFVAATFHPYVLMFTLVPLLTFKPWTSKTYIMLAVFLAAGFMLESLLGTIVDITSMIGDTYSETAFIGDGINIFRVLVANVPLFLTWMYQKTLFRNSTKTENLMVNLAMLNGAIMFVGMFGTAIYFSRMASYFTITQCVALPWILSKLSRKQKQFYTAIMVIGYCGFFVYANIISQSFDVNFSRITLLEYLRNYVFK